MQPLALSAPIRPIHPGATSMPRLVDAFVERLVQLGVRTAYGVVGGAVAPLAEALDRHPDIEVVHTRHEAGAAFAATEESLATERPVVVMTTTGPGITNALTGLYVARSEGARIVFISGATPAARRERNTLQESHPSALLGGLYQAGPLFHDAALIEHPDALIGVLRRLARGLQRPHGFVAHVALPTDLQSRPLALLELALDARAPRSVDPRDVDESVKHLARGRVVLWVGFGARHHAKTIAALAERLDALVMSTPRGKGVFDENNPRYLGATGLGGHDGPVVAMQALRPDHVLVLGSRLGELSTSFDPRLVPARGFIHVDIDPEVPGRGYPDVPTFAVQAELGVFLDGLLAALPPSRPRSVPPAWRADWPVVDPHPRTLGAVRPSSLVAAIQRVVVEGSDARLLADAGNSLGWATHYLRFDRPGRLRMNLDFASMGHAAAGVLGAARHGPGKAIALVGDGAMLMNCEVSTAVRYRIPAVWIVLNDSSYGMVEHGMRDAGLSPVQTAIPRTDFAALAQAMGAEGIRVAAERELHGALRRALVSPDPCVVDVIIDPTMAPPVGSRFDGLRAQGVCAGGNR